MKDEAELTDLLANFGPDALFRGQVREYGDPNAPLINTSFQRNGCIPPLMLRWSYYARFALTALLRRPHADTSIEFIQAVLQHYGWRSFFVDATTDPAVAAWFGAHSFSMRRTSELCEDCFEDGVFLIKDMAQYDFGDGEGHLYVLSRSALAGAAIGSVDLSEIKLEGARARFEAQRAWLIGPLKSDLPPACIEASIAAPRSVLRAFAAGKGFMTTDHLFPPIEEDPVLDVLMSLPWSKVEAGPVQLTMLEFFRCSLELPQYQDSFRKRLPPHVALYQGGRVDGSIDAPDIHFIDVSADVMFGSADLTATPKLPTILRHVQENGRVVYEIPMLARMPENPRSQTYVKGIALEARGELVAVADFVVDHPGQQMAGVAINFPWYYKVEADGTWVRQADEGDCPCAFPWRHEHHLSVLSMIEAEFEKRCARLRGQRKDDQGS